MAADVTLFEPRNAVAWKSDIRLRRSVPGDHNFEGDVAPAGTSIAYYLKSAPSGDVTITIRPIGGGEVFRTLAGTKNAGMNQVRWNLCSDRRPARPGEGGGGFGGGGNPCATPVPLAAAEETPGPGGQQQPQRVSRLATPGAYVVTLTVNGRDYSRALTVLEDVWMDQR
jgi:hypothetical protein